MRASELRPGEFPAKRSSVGVWMHDEYRCESVARMVAIDAMIALGLDPHDFRTRDKIITCISDRINGTLDYVHGWDEPQRNTIFDTVAFLRKQAERYLQLAKDESSQVYQGRSEGIYEAIANIEYDNPPSAGDVHNGRVDSSPLLSQPVVFEQTATLQLREGWRWLEVGEVIERGDEYRHFDKWMPVFDSPGDKVPSQLPETFCRKIAEVPPPVDQQKLDALLNGKPWPPAEVPPVSCDYEGCNKPAVNRVYVGPLQDANACDEHSREMPIQYPLANVPPPVEPDKFSTTDGFRAAPLPNRTDSEGRDVTDLPGLWGENDKVEPEPDADGWIEHDGRDCPVANGTIVDVRYRNGKVVRSVPANVNTEREIDAWSCFWDKQSDDYDIVAYRLVQPAPTVNECSLRYWWVQWVTPPTLDDLMTTDKRGEP